MSNIKSNITGTSQLYKKLIKDLNVFLKDYINLEKEISSQFYEEYKHNDFNIAGLEDFQRLKSLCKKNLNVVKTVNGLLDKMYDLSMYEIDEEVL